MWKRDKNTELNLKHLNGDRLSMEGDPAKEPE